MRRCSIGLVRTVVVLVCTMIGILGLAMAQVAPAASVGPGVMASPLRYGVLADFPPYQVWPAGGSPGGVDVAMMRLIADRLGRRLVTVRYADYRELEADLVAGRIDLASSMARTPARTTVMAFSQPYATVLQALVTRAGEPSGSLSPDLAGRSLAVVSGFASEDQIERLFPIASRVIVPNVLDGLKAVRGGRADTFVEALPVVLDTIEREGLDGLQIARTFETPAGRLHFVVPIANRADIAAIDTQLRLIPPETVASMETHWSASAGDPRPSPGAELTPRELERTSQALRTPVIAVSAADRAPFIAVEGEQRPIGLVVDATRAILQRLGAGTPTWRVLSPEAIWSGLENGSIDFAIGLDEETRVGKSARFVGPVIEYPMVLMGRPQGAAFDLDQLNGRRLALTPDHPARPLIESRHPGIEVVTCPSLSQCLDMVSAGTAVATMSDVVSGSNALSERRRAEVQIVGTETRVRRAYSLAVAARHTAIVPMVRQAVESTVIADLPELKTRWLAAPSSIDVAARLVQQYAPWVIGALALLVAGWAVHAHLLRREVERTRRAQAAAEAARSAGQRFTSFMAHEVRNSLHSVIAGAHLLRTADIASQSLSVSLAESARSTLLLLNNLLERDRLDAGRVTLRNEPARLLDTLASVVRELQPAAQSHGLSLQLETAGDAGDRDLAGDPLLLIDAMRVQQIVRNLVVNAVKHSASGRVAVRVTSSANKVGWRDITVAVEDQGRGIPIADHARVFEPFYRVESTKEVPASGTGLGLALCRDLARLMHGDLTLDSEPGVGTTITLRWPAEVAAVAAPNPQTSDGTNGQVATLDPTPGPSPIRTLLVEDAHSYALVLQAALGRRGFDVSIVASVNQAAAALGEDAFDLLLCDMNLPDGDALRVAEAAARTPHGRPQIIVITAELDDLDMEPLRRLGVAQALAKTPDASMLANQIRDGWQRSPAAEVPVG